jgi:hypothetical protein
MSRRRFIAGLVLASAGLSTVPAVAAQAQPRAARLKNLPDWSGIWVSAATDIDISGYPTAGLTAMGLKLLGTTAPLTAERRAKLAAELPGMMAADAQRKAQGWGYPLMMEGIAPMQFLVTSEETLILNFYRDLRHVYTDGRQHLPEEDRWPTPWGDSVGRWEGDTLVIETVSVQFGAIFPLLLPPLSDQARFVERLRKIDRDHLELQMTIDDAMVLSQPWAVTILYKRAAGLDRLIHNAFENDRSAVEGDSLTIAPPQP